MTAKLDDVGEAVGKLAERVDALVKRRADARRSDSYLCEEPVPTDKYLRKADARSRSRGPSLSSSEDRTAYRGYSLQRASNGDWHVSKDGYHITTQSSLEKAKRSIDEIAG